MQKHGIIERENYNKPKSENSRQPGTTPEKEKAITEALICCRSYLYDQIAIDPDSKTHVFAAPNEIENSFIELEGEYTIQKRSAAY